MTSYIAEQRTWGQEATRLVTLENALDRNSVRYLEQLGVTTGTRCLEVGAGSGSIARWMAERSGAAGRVVATDLDTTLLVPLAANHTQLEVLQSNIEHESPRLVDGGLFDIAHARLVVGHVPDRARALRNIVDAVRPGGWVLIEDVDFVWTEVGEQPIHPEAMIEPYFRVWHAVVALMREGGYAVHWGRRLAGALRDLGLEFVSGEAVMMIGDRALQRAMRLTIERFAMQLVAAQQLEERAVQACLEVMDASETIFTSSPMFSVWGRRAE